MKFKLCVMAAGRGSRIFLSKIVHKALLPVGNIAAISHIMSKTSPEVEIVIAVGYESGQIKDFIKIAHPERKVTFVDVDNWDQPGSGPGYSLLACRRHLDGPFVFTSCDTIILENIPVPDKNWIGVEKISDPSQFCMAEVSGGLVKRFHDKVDQGTLKAICPNYEDLLKHAFIGMAGIYDYQEFWDALENKKTDLIKNELQVSNGLKRLIEEGLQTVQLTWFDTGNEEAYEKTCKFFSKNQVLSKQNEFIYFEEDKVVKFFADETTVTSRVRRASILKGVVPAITDHAGHFYAYRFVPGENFSQITDIEVMSQFLEFCKQRLWRKADLDPSGKSDFRAKSMSFYKDKTIERVNRFLSQTGIQDGVHRINGRQIPPAAQLLSMVDWNALSDGVPSLIHGDLQPENVIVTPEGGFILLDWRQDFGGELEYGDLYYDFAKIHHALIISGEVIRKNEFSVLWDRAKVSYNFLMKHNLQELMSVFRGFIERERYDWPRIELLSSLILLNIAPLHHEPYNTLLFFLGKTRLHQLLMNTSHSYEHLRSDRSYQAV